jgi:hypothetical protein
MARLGWKGGASIAGVVVILAVGAGAWFSGWWPFGGDGSAPTPNPSSSASPTNSATPAVAFVERQVTVAAHVPTSELLTKDVLNSAGSGWVVAIHDATAIDSKGVEAPGPRILYLISPDGTRYELANLDTLGVMAPDLVAWDYGRHKVLIVDNLRDMKVFDMTRGAIDASWSYCDNKGYVRGSARDGAWLLRGSCGGEGIDGIYGDDGTPVPSPVVGKGFGFTVFDIGSVQVQSEFETAPDARFIAFSADGTKKPIPSSMAGDCYMIGKGSGATFVAYCYASDGGVSVWEFPVDGSAPVDVIPAAQLEAFRSSLGVPGPADYFVSGYCAANAQRVLEVTWSESRLGKVTSGGLDPLAAAPHPFRHCLATSGSNALVSGDGLLWITNLDTGTSTELLPGSGPGGVTRVVGTDGYRALLQP